MTIQQKTENNIHIEPGTVGKKLKIKKKEKKNQKMCLEKKMEKEENEGRYEHFFCFQWLLGFRTVTCFIVLLLYFITVILLINSTWGRAVH